jgi:hypothetical protein
MLAIASFIGFGLPACCLAACLVIYPKAGFETRSWLGRSAWQQDLKKRGPCLGLLTTLIVPPRNTIGHIGSAFSERPGNMSARTGVETQERSSALRPFGRTSQNSGRRLMAAPERIGPRQLGVH